MIDVSKYNLLLNDKPAAHIKFGSSDKVFCSIAVLKSSAKNKYNISIFGSTSLDVEVDLTCFKSGKHYAMSTKKDTYINLQAVKHSSQSVEYILNAKLISIDHQSYLNITDTVLKINGNNFKILKK